MTIPVEIIESLEDVMFECLKTLDDYHVEISSDLGLTDIRKVYINSLRVIKFVCKDSRIYKEKVLPTVKKVYAATMVTILLAQVF